MEPLQKLTEEQKSENARRKREALEEGEREKLKEQGGRTDEEITCQAPLKVVLGGKELALPILAYNPCRKWRDAFRVAQKHAAELGVMAKGKDPQDIKPEDVEATIELSERVIFDDRVDLVVLYLELTGIADASILDVATQPELVAAYDAIEKVASPLSLAPVPQA